MVIPIMIHMVVDVAKSVVHVDRGKSMDMRYSTNPYLMHYGVQGMKWGIRKYVNYDGSLTPEGIKKYGTKANMIRAGRQRGKNLTTAVHVVRAATVPASAYAAYRDYKRYGNRNRAAAIAGFGIGTALGSQLVERHYNKYINRSKRKKR